LGLVLSLVACKEKASDEGALRVSVKYGTYVPGCLRVAVRDAQGHEARTDIPREKFQNPEAREVRVAVFREPEWDSALTLEVASYRAASGETCEGAPVERRSSNGPMAVLQGEVTVFEAVLQAEDRDGDSFIVLPGIDSADCDDRRADVYPGAAEQCSTSVDFDCDGFKGCQDTKCLNRACDDGNACTTGDQCTGASVCAGRDTPCSPSNSCLRVTGGCTALNTCTEEPDPSKVNKACSAGTVQGVCRVPDGVCSAFPYVPSNFDPDAVAGASIGTLDITCDVTFDSTPGLLAPWIPPGCVKAAPQGINVQGSGAPDAVLLPVRSVSMAGNLTLVGIRPVILAVYGDAALTKNILANGHRSGSEVIPGPGGNQSCGNRQGGKGADGGEGGGGGGAGGETVGAVGGQGQSGAAGGSAGNAYLGMLAPLTGGCPGGKGGNSRGAQGGAGGGALQISVAGTLTAGAWVTSSGGGGLGGEADSTGSAGGGGGGGSGGGLLLEAHRLIVSKNGVLTANGGGGGEGGGTSNAGMNGEDGARSSADVAKGGAGNAEFGGDGGDGGTRSVLPTQGQGGTANGGGGGGGGGAVGSIRLKAVLPCEIDNASVRSPAPVLKCPL
jgi:hypothetical protein